MYKIVLEKRKKIYMFGALNYGDIPKLINQADGDPWDVLVPGIGRTLKTQCEYEIKDVLGVFLLENGNHKICVSLKKIRTNQSLARIEIANYVKRYCSFTKKQGMYFSIDALMGTKI